MRVKAKPPGLRRATTALTVLSRGATVTACTTVFLTGAGLKRFSEYLAALADVGYDGPLTFHSEYPNVSLDELRALTRDDVAYLRGLIDSA